MEVISSSKNAYCIFWITRIRHLLSALKNRDERRPSFWPSHLQQINCNGFAEGSTIRIDSEILDRRWSKLYIIDTIYKVCTYFYLTIS